MWIYNVNSGDASKSTGTYTRYAWQNKWKPANKNRSWQWNPIIYPLLKLRYKDVYISSYDCWVPHAFTLGREVSFSWFTFPLLSPISFPFRPQWLCHLVGHLARLSQSTPRKFGSLCVHLPKWPCNRYKPSNSTRYTSIVVRNPPLNKFGIGEGISHSVIFA